MIDLASSRSRATVYPHRPSKTAVIQRLLLLGLAGVIGGCTDTNEINYLLVKAFRAGLGIIPMEQQARI